MPDLVETVSGQGKVFSGERFVANVRYKVRVYRQAQRIDLLSGPQISEPPSETTELDISEPIEAAFGEPLTLHLADGRKLDFWFVGSECKLFGGLH